MKTLFRDRLRTGKRILAVMILTMLMSAAFTCAVCAGPLVIKDSKTGEGVENETGEMTQERDRTLQDGTLIYGMTPVYPEDFREGTYDAEAISDSQFFKITGAKLTNQSGRIRAVMRISSTSYAYVYPGTAAEAAAADQSEWIPADESSGYGEFTIEAEALNKELPCAAYSKKKAKWYDRNIVFLASSIPEDALLIDIDEEGETIADTQEAALKVIYIAIGIIVGGGILNFFIKRKYYE